MTDERVPADTSLRGALRALRGLFGDGALAAAGSGPALERIAMRSDPPSVAPCVLLEGPGARPIEVPADPLVVAFLDGVQRSRVVGYHSGSPLIYASVAAAVRARVARRLESWCDPRVRRALYASRGRLGEPAWNQLVESGVPVVDITADLTADAIPVHPLALRARALDLVALEREGLERRLAADWCRRESRWLWIDGGISGNLAVDERATAFGVVKSHTTLYGSAEQVASVLALAEAERSPAFLVGHRPRRAVASWYLRLRTAAGGDPLHGLVRVEISPPADMLDPEHITDDARARFTAHCDRIAGGILAERAPLSRPDPRWDTLTYGIHACEMYLDALVGI
ncbi:hypothetical protein [Gemmatimonas sp.]|uniref:hypothetical protein n=1 Tax=Gemmatimonas sp. TaxID=1962908 RepID=UPI0039839D59